MSWLLCRSQLAIENNILLYKCILKRAYDVKLWGCTKTSNTKIIQSINNTNVANNNKRRLVPKVQHSTIKGYWDTITDMLQK